MRETRLIASNELAIRLEGNKPSYAPGDSIVGYIVRGAPIVTPQAWITVTVGGRVKSRVAGKSYSGPSGRWEVIPEQTHFQKIHEGPLHVDASLPGHERERAWPFSIDIPWYIDYGLTAGKATQPTQPGLTDVEDAAHQLPDSMLEKEYAGMGTDPFAEYWVKAELRSAEQASIDRCVAIHPFILRKTTRKPPMSSESRPTHRYAAAASVCSDRLIPDPSANLSFFQKIFGSQQTTPTFAGQMEFEIPAVIQLEHPDPIPLCLRFVVDRRKTSPEVLNAVAWPKISLLRLMLEIEARTVIRDDIPLTAPTSGTLDITWKGDEHTINVPLRIWSASSDMQEPLHIPVSSGHGTNEATPPVDVGRLLGIHVRRTGIVGSMFTPSALIPSCATVAFRHSHHVKVILDAEVGGKQIQCRFRRDMTILAPGEVDHSGRDGVWRQQDEEMQPPPVFVGRSGDTRPPPTDRAYEDEFPPPIYGRSDSWIRPPPVFEPPPPTFAEVEREDLLRRGRIQTV